MFLSLLSNIAHALPKGFVYLKDVAPDIIEDMRYSTHNNFVGNPIPGYLRGRCILTKQAAEQLKKAQKEIKPKGYSLKVYDCYRPQQAVDYFFKWSQNTSDQRKKAQYYPREYKNELFKKEYIAQRSGHTRGSTLDLTLVKLPKIPKKIIQASLTRCYDKTPKYLDDNSINMGTRFDCFDKSAYIDYPNLSKEQENNRLILHNLMIRNGFKPYLYEWWHYTLENEPYPDTYFNFKVW